MSFSTSLFKNILVPYDGSFAGLRAFNAAVQIAKKFDSKLTILTCLEKESTLVFFETKKDKRKYKKLFNKIAKKISVLEKKAKENEVMVRSKILRCAVASKSIVSYTRTHKVDLIVMSKSNTMSSKKIYHESTVNYVYDNVRCPMLDI